MIVVDDLVYSPVDHGDKSADIVGAARVLVAPNHYHHLAIPRYRNAFPEVTVIASDGARPRLAKQGHADVRALDAVKLPDGVRLLPVEGVKNGETWMVVERDGNKTLVVCDAFMNVESECTGFEGFMLRRLRVVPGLQLSRTFTMLAIGDKKKYRQWATDTLEREKPDVMMFSHGAPLPNAWQRAIEVIERFV